MVAPAPRAPIGGILGVDNARTEPLHRLRRRRVCGLASTTLAFTLLLPSRRRRGGISRAVGGGGDSDR
jgi:hypothetical protein